MTKSPQSDDWFISTSEELVRACAALNASAWLAIDTEFERSRTFYAELCLLQIAAPGLICCIDPLAPIALTPLIKLLNEYSGVKVLHAARQDLEVLYALTGQVLSAPVFDTQIAAALVGFADNIGYADLVSQILGVALDKSQTRTDWRQRPLTPAQLSYAADDVRYLDGVAVVLRERLAQLGRSEWLVEDCTALLNPTTYVQPVTSAWQRIKGIGALTAGAFARAIALASWRESMAREQNLPRGWVLKDNELLDIAVGAPTSASELAAIGGTAAIGLLRRHREAVIELLHQPTLEPTPLPPRRLNAAGRALGKNLSAKAQAIAQDLAIAPTVLVARRELDGLIRGEMPARLQTGWRRTVLAPLLAEISPDGDPTCWEK